MLVAVYDSSDAYVSQEQWDDLDKEDQESISVGDYDEDMDSWLYTDYENEVRYALEKRKFPLVLAARKSNWRGQDGFARVNSIEELLQKVASFDSGSIELHKTRDSAFHFKMGGTHDVPTGFIIELKPFNQAYWS